MFRCPHPTATNFTPLSAATFTTRHRIVTLSTYESTPGSEIMAARNKAQITESKRRTRMRHQFSQN